MEICSILKFLYSNLDSKSNYEYVSLSETLWDLGFNIVKIKLKIAHINEAIYLEIQA